MIMKYCKDCKSYNKGFRKIKKFNVSINANFCDDYKVKFSIKLKELLNYGRG